MEGGRGRCVSDLQETESKVGQKGSAVTDKVIHLVIHDHTYNHIATLQVSKGRNIIFKKTFHIFLNERCNNT